MEALSKEQIPFIFKGGTSLLLLFNRPYRLSIDIDIIFEEDISKLPDLIDILVSKSIFIRWENDVRQSHNVPKSHYKIFYKSTIRNREEDYILLDILAESNPYPEIISKPITSPLILNRHKPTEVRLPDIDGMLGDKLTAFAPNTTGIPYGKDKEQEIIKQLFDIELLFHEAKDLRKVNLSFNTIASREIQYRSQNIAPSDVLDDIFHFFNGS